MTEDRIAAIKARRAKITPGGEVFALNDHVDDHDLEFIIHARSDIDYLLTRCVELLQWVDDLQSGMYVNCVYCGHRYGPGETTPVSMADALKAHIEQCPEHPMSRLKEKYEVLLSAARLMASELPASRAWTDGEIAISEAVKASR